LYLPGVRGLLFDLDGVLVDSAPAWHAALNALRRAEGLPDVPDEVFEPRFGQSVSEDVDFFFGGAFSAEELSRRYDATFPSVLHLVRPLEAGIRERIDAFRERGLRLAVTTNSPRVTARSLLEVVGLAAAFDRVVTADDVVQPKPAPEMLHTACRELGVRETEALLLGDSPVDVAAADAAGVCVVSYRTSAAPLRVDSLEELERCLLQSSPSRGMSSSSNPR